MKNQLTHSCGNCVDCKACGKVIVAIHNKKEEGEIILNKYTELKSKHQKEVDAFPFGFAFNKDQYDEMMTKWGFKPTHRSQVMYLESGCFIRKSDYKAMNEMFRRHEEERKASMQDDEYLYQMFNYELANHEYCVTYDLTDTLEALDLTMEEINADQRMADALKRAIAAQED